MIHVHPASDHLVVVHEGCARRIDASLDDLFTQEDPHAFLVARSAGAPMASVPAASRAVLQSQEVWAAGVTYFRSMTARKEESAAGGGATFYDKVYLAERPELFFKAAPHRVAASGEAVRIRKDATWNVPEPELTLAINARGRIFGYTIGNDMSSRDIEGENPLYLPQAKVYDRSAALGPALLVAREPLPRDTQIAIEIERAGAVIFREATTIDQIKRSFESLVEFLFRDQTFPHGCYLMTGTGIVPPANFTLEPNDVIRITIPPIGTLINSVTRLS
ncbi:MAG TPA: fumarylacetoacetate hydrolase family protein [Candidatus Synoicihabitans sp.]|nr:fumarylacetoacetate hydrolase family protein [Candidatus Synoicihabitans sp.]